MTGASPGTRIVEQKRQCSPLTLRQRPLPRQRQQRVADKMHDCVRVTNLDAAAFNIPPRPIAMLLDEIDAYAAKLATAAIFRTPWRRLVASAGPPAVLALAMLPPPGRGGALRLPSGARRRLRDTRILSKTNAPDAESVDTSTLKEATSEEVLYCD